MTGHKRLMCERALIIVHLGVQLVGTNQFNKINVIVFILSFGNWFNSLVLSTSRRMLFQCKQNPQKMLPLSLIIIFILLF